MFGWPTLLFPVEETILVTDCSLDTRVVFTFSLDVCECLGLTSGTLSTVDHYCVYYCRCIV